MDIVERGRGGEVGREGFESREGGLESTGKDVDAERTVHGNLLLNADLVGIYCSSDFAREKTLARDETSAGRVEDVRLGVLLDELRVGKGRERSSKVDSTAAAREEGIFLKCPGDGVGCQRAIPSTSEENRRGETHSMKRTGSTAPTALLLASTSKSTVD